MNNIKKIKYLIIGAGVTGISFANFKKNDDYLILESDKEIGGYCKTIKKGDFTWDYSGHFFHFQNKEIHDLVFKNINKKDLIFIENKITSIFYKNAYIDFPFQKNIHQLNKQEFIECLYDLYKREKKESSSFKEMVNNNFGKAISQKFLIPYNEKLYCTDLNTLDKNAMGRFFPYASLDEIIENFKNTNNNSYNDSFTYHKGGAIEYINSLVKNIDNSKILLNSKVIKINKLEKYIITNNGKKIFYKNLISTSPFDNLLNMLEDNSGKKILSANKVLVFNIGFNKGTKNKNHWIYFPEKDYIFYRVGFYNNIMGTKKLSLYIEIGLKQKEKYDKKIILKQVLNDLKKAKIIDDHKIEEYESLIMNPAYIHIKKESENFKQNKFKELEKNNIYSIGRYGEWKYCSIEDNIIDAKNLSNKI